MIHLNYPVDDPGASPTSRSRPTSARRSGIGDLPMADPQDHALVGGRGPRLVVPGRARVPGRRRRPPASAHRRAGADERDPRRAEPVLEARGGPRRRRVAGAARHLRGRAAAGGRAQLPALARERASTTSRSPPRSASRLRTHPRRTWRCCGGVWSGRPEDAEQRSRCSAPDARAVDGVLASSTSSTATRTTSQAVVSDGSPAPAPLDDIRVYEPSHPPGRAPAARLDRRRGRQPPRDQGPRRRRGGSC